MRATLHTNGRGLWSRKAKAVRVTRIKQKGSEMRVYFDPRSWNVRRDGLIYTDKLFLKELRTKLRKAGIRKHVEYSEQGMQGNDYVSLDVWTSKQVRERIGRKFSRARKKRQLSAAEWKRRFGRSGRRGVKRRSRDFSSELRHVSLQALGRMLRQALRNGDEAKVHAIEKEIDRRMRKGGSHRDPTKTTRSAGVAHHTRQGLSLSREAMSLMRRRRYEAAASVLQDAIVEYQDALGGLPASEKRGPRARRIYIAIAHLRRTLRAAQAAGSAY